MSQIQILQCPGRAFFVGDLHGEFAKLQIALKQCQFDPLQGDQLFCVGDLIDRGPDSLGCLSLVSQPWFHAIQGNHERMMLDAIEGDAEQQALWHDAGGDWYQSLTPELQDHAANLALHWLHPMPLILEVELPQLNARIGLIHADCPGNDWRALAAQAHAGLDRRDTAICQWSRDTLNHMSQGKYPAPIQGIDAVVFGHTPQSMIRSHGNRVWLDTGAGYQRGHLSLLSAEQVLEILR
ncbi:metallophosphoesterase [Ferrimonas pelagia]|uniref:Metallophosphoesterase n=1 Tax=Ferrimonas pelagia TaxID=1177826 RepID=A0ABP9FIR2_9GAMM